MNKCKLIILLLCLSSSSLYAQYESRYSSDYSGGDGTIAVIIGLPLLLYFLYNKSTRKAAIYLILMFVIPTTFGFLGMELFGIFGSMIGFIFGLFVHYKIWSRDDVGEKKD